MTVFLLSCATVLVIALVWIGAPLWRKQFGGQASSEALQTASNKSALQAQLLEAEQELAAGRLDEASFKETEHELARRLVEETQAQETALNQTGAQPVLFVCIALFAVALTVGLYLDLGRPNLVIEQALAPTVDSVQQDFDVQQAQLRVEQLRQQLEANAQDPSAWVELARLERRLGDTAASTRSYQHAVMMAQEDAGKTELQLEMIETFALHAEQNGGAIPPMALSLANDVLSRHAEHPRALWYGAMLAESAGQRMLAIERVETLLALNPPPQIKTALEQQLSAWLGQEQAGTKKPSPAVTSRAIVVDVDIPNGVDLGNTNAATLFVYARAVNGPRMPIVVWRHESPIFPLQAKLDDSLAMLPGTKLSDYESLEVLARVSFSGDAISQPGDWFGSQIIQQQQNQVSIDIDQMVE